MTDEKNRRATPRLTALLRVDYPHLTSFLADYSENISRHGLFIVTETDHPIGSEVTFQLSFAGLLSPLVLKGVVRWKRRAGMEGPAGIGIEIIFEDPSKEQAMARLVASAEAAAEGRAPPEAPPEKDEKDERRQFGILLAEDNPHVREMFAYGMSKLAARDPERVKIEVFATADGNDAWTKLTEHAMNLIICDMYMPVLDGTEFIKRVRQSPMLKDTPIIAVSSGGHDARIEALEAGADIFLPKPVKLTDIIATVGTLLRLGK